MRTISRGAHLLELVAEPIYILSQQITHKMLIFLGIIGGIGFFAFRAIVMRQRPNRQLDQLLKPGYVLAQMLEPHKEVAALAPSGVRDVARIGMGLQRGGNLGVIEW